MHVSSHQVNGGGSAPSVCILGASMDVENRGVRALATSIAVLVHEVLPGAELRYHYGNRQGGVRRIQVGTGSLAVRVLNCRQSPRSSLQESIWWILACAILERLGLRGPARRSAWHQSLATSGIVCDIRGGDSFSDIYGVRRFIAGSLPLTSVRLRKLPYILLPQTFGPFRSSFSRVLAQWLIDGASEIFVRDKRSRDVIHELTGRAATLCPDVAFTLPPRQTDRAADAWALIRTQQPVIGFNISGLLHMGGYTGTNMFGLKADYPTAMALLLDGLLRKTSASILLLPHEFGGENEVAACRQLLTTVAPQYSSRVTVMPEELDERELKWLIGRMDFFIGARMHACIAALSQGVPTAALAYSDKFYGVFDVASASELVIDLRRSDSSQILHETMRLWERRQELRLRLVDRSASLAQEVRTRLGCRFAGLRY